MWGRTVAAVAANRRRLAAHLGQPKIQWLQQVHGVTVRRATSGTVAQAPAADAVWTDQRGLALAIMTADCVPVLLAEQGGEVIGAAHAGWRGLEQGVLAALLTAMPVAASALHAWIGPHISAARYEVGEDVWRHFEPAECGEHPDPAKRYLDLGAVTRRQLTGLGVAHIETSARCSYDDANCYSWRRAMVRGCADTGRMSSVILRI